MLVDLSLKGTNVLVVGAGKVGLRKARSVLGECDSLVLVSSRFSKEAKRLGEAGARLVKADLGADSVLRTLFSEADLVIIATDDNQLNHRVAGMAHAMGLLVASVDNPSDSDFNFPAVRAIGDIRVGVTTGGRSPAMARVLCEKLAASVTPEDRVWVDLMSFVSSSARDRFRTPAERRRAVYRVLADAEVGSLVRGRRLAEAKAASEAIIGGR